MMIGFATTIEAAASNSCTNYNTEIVSLRDGSYGLLARNGHDYRSPFGASDIRLHLPDRWIDNQEDARNILGMH